MQEFITHIMNVNICTHKGLSSYLHTLEMFHIQLRRSCVLGPRSRQANPLKPSSHDMEDDL
jgi:hypothetical protein